MGIEVPQSPPADGAQVHEGQTNAEVGRRRANWDSRVAGSRGDSWGVP